MLNIYGMNNKQNIGPCRGKKRITVTFFWLQTMLNWCRLFVFFRTNTFQSLKYRTSQSVCLEVEMHLGHTHRETDTNTREIIPMKPNECSKDENGSNVYILSRIQCHVPICCFAFVYPLCHVISFWLFVLFVHFLRVYTFIFGWLCRRRYKLLTAIRSDSHGVISNNTMKKKNRIFMKNVPEYFCLLSRQPFGDGFCG